MIHDGFTDRTTAWILATFMIFFGDSAMASSLKLADPSELAGKWQATLFARADSPQSPALQDNPANLCILELKANQTLGEGAGCLSAWLGEHAAGWFTEPDGIAITGTEGSKILFFSRQRDGLYQGALQSGLNITLSREVH
ncbi:AprI/Inh family metalloprotease inhibitor [Pseudomonas silesiensis]|uniref:AprI/Inh family metalloprotease inhibitor n=1 Tax=Pseudomonas silesiensis TaxID=1853130 RepID=UPI0030CD8E2E